jgi:hypothetical protein
LAALPIARRAGPAVFRGRGRVGRRLRPLLSLPSKAPVLSLRPFPTRRTSAIWARVAGGVGRRGRFRQPYGRAAAFGGGFTRLPGSGRQRGYGRLARVAERELLGLLGQFEVGLFEGALDARQFVDDPAVAGRVFPDLGRRQVPHDRLLGPFEMGLVAVAAEIVGQFGRLGRTDPRDDAGNLLDQLVHPSVHEEAAPAHDDDAVGRQSHFGHEVARQKNGPPFGGEVFDEVPDPGHALRVEPVDGLIEDQRGGVAEKRGSEAETLSHAERETTDPFLGDGLKAGHLDDFVHSAAADAVGRRQGAQVGAGAPAGMGRLGVEQRSDLAERSLVVFVGAAVDRHPASRRPVES